MKVLVVMTKEGLDSVHGPFDDNEAAEAFSFIHESRIPMPDALEVKYIVTPLLSVAE